MGSNPTPGTSAAREIEGATIASQPGRDTPELVAFVADAYPTLAGALTRVAARSPELGAPAAEEAVITALTRWKQVAHTRSPIGWCYLRGLEELRSSGVQLPDADRDLLAADDVGAAAERMLELHDAGTGVAPPPVDPGAVVQRARKRRSLQTLVGMVIALGGVVVVAMLLTWMQSPTS